MIEKMYNVLPSFFGSRFSDGDGKRYLDPLLELHEMAARDTLQRMGDINNVLDIERCPNILKERFKAFEFGRPLSENTFRYPLSDQNVIHVEKLYNDVKFQNEFAGDFKIGYDIIRETRFIEFDNPQNNTLYAEDVYVDIYPVISFYGKLLGHTPIIRLYSDAGGDEDSNIYYVDFANVLKQLEAARNEAFALLRYRMTGTTVGGLTNFVAAVLGCTVSPVGGTVTGIEGTVVTVDTGRSNVWLKGIEAVTPCLSRVNESDSVVRITCAGSVNTPSVCVGRDIKRFDLLSSPPIRIYDFYSEPARFTQTLLAGKAKILEDLLKIDTKLKESYAALFWDTNLKWDEPDPNTGGWLLFYDMGDHSWVKGLGEPSSYYGLPIDGEQTVSSFTGTSSFADLRFAHTYPPHSIAEIFSNVTIIEVNEGDVATVKERLNRFLPMIKQIFTKFVVIYKATLLS